MSSSTPFKRQGSDEHDYLFQIHRQTMQLCDEFSTFKVQVGRQFDAVFTEFEKVHGRLDGLEVRVDRLESKVDRLAGKVDKLEGRMDRIVGKVDKIEGRIGQLETDNAEIKSTLKLILEKLS